MRRITQPIASLLSYLTTIWSSNSTIVSAINHLESEFRPLFVYARRSIEDAVIEALRPNEAGERRTLLRELRLDFQRIHQGSYSVLS